MGQIAPGIVPAGMDHDEAVNLDGFGGHGVSFISAPAHVNRPD
jgi:hypothetical protein